MKVKGAKLSPPAQPEAALYLRYADVEGSWLLAFVAVCRHFRGGGTGIRTRDTTIFSPAAEPSPTLSGDTKPLRCAFWPCRVSVRVGGGCCHA